ncbi:MAG: CRISPR-associated protein Cmr3 [Acidobacteria bacterium]|nr:CRISPR-associated protein Cmr3 [Acidobacteriota bacterium]
MSLDPLAPIIVRSGRPMSAHADADPAQFPPPSTIAGCLRTAWARAAGRLFGPELAQLAVGGPLLVREDGRILAPKPVDALYFGRDGKSGSPRCVRARPRPFGGGCGADLPEGLLPVQLTEKVKGKPGDGPTWWSWHDLLDFRGGIDVPLDRLWRNGWSPPGGDRRTHVSIDPSSGSAKAGALYETEGLDLGESPVAFHTRAAGRAAAASPADPYDDADNPSSGGLRLLVRCAEALAPALVHLGGKRRLAALEPEPDDRWPAPPDGWLERICHAGGLCLTLLTPGVFSAGYRPGWLDAALTGSPPEAPGLTLRLRAAAVARWQPHSGWDLARSQPRPARKLVPAGATYWFEVLGACDANAAAALWLASVCDEAQDRVDGFGLALPGPWAPPTGQTRSDDPTHP